MCFICGLIIILQDIDKHELELYIKGSTISWVQKQNLSHDMLPILYWANLLPTNLASERAKLARRPAENFPR